MQDLTTWYEKVASPYDATMGYDTTVYNTTVYYNPDLNIILNSIAKNCSSSMEVISPAFGFVEVSLYSDLIRSSGVKPKVISVLRDPVERFRSAITMLIDQHRRLGLELTPENFVALDYAVDMHLLPQTLSVIRNKHVSIKRIPDNNRYTYKYQDFDKWSDFFELFGFGEELEQEYQDFYYMYSGVDVITQIFNDIGIELTDSVYTKQNAADRPLEELSAEMTDFVKNFYAVDYELIELVEFKNKQD